MADIKEDDDFGRDRPELQCRFYEAKYPAVDECVMVNVRSIAEMGAYVALLEYNNVEGMVMHSELSRRRIRSINKLIRVGKNEVVMVIRVDQDKGYIDISKKRVSPEDVAKCEDRYNKAKAVHSILRHVAAGQDMTLESLYLSIGWPLYRRFGHAYEGFKAALADSAVFAALDKPNDLSDAAWATLKTQVLENVRRRMAPTAMKLRADIEVSCFTSEGIDAIKTALLAGQACTNGSATVVIKLIAPPTYVMTTNNADSKEVGLELLNTAIATIQREIESRGGSLTIKTAPRVTSQQDDSALTKQLQQLTLDQTEVDGDDDEESEDGDD